MLSMITGPLLGGIIGLITNGIAIRMLFRPLKPIKIFGKTLPFTPGLIPKERGRIARSVGNVIATNLISEESLSRNLLSDEMDNRILSWIDCQLDQLRDHPTKLHTLLTTYFSDEQVINAADTFQSKATELLYRKACTINLGAVIAETALSEVRKHPLFASFGFMISEDMLLNIKEKIQETVDQMITEHGEAIIRDMVEQETLNVLTLSTDQIYEKLIDHESQIKQTVLSAYHSLVKNHLSQVLKAIDIAGLVENEINRFDLLELEHIILSLMKKELNAIIALGGLLGVVMGCLMNFF